MWAENNINLGDYFSNVFIKNFVENFEGKSQLYETLGITGGFGTWQPNPKTTKIWGRGFFGSERKEDIGEYQRNIKVYAIRGQLSLNQYRKWMNIQTIDIACGDPGILASSMHRIVNPKKMYKIGFVPHWYDRYTYKEVFEKYHDVFHLIKIDGDPDIHKFWDDLNSCEIIFTSSLHGSVFAHSYGIPSYYVCMEKSNQFTRGRNYKFVDYYSNYDNLEMPKYNFYDEIVPLIECNMLYKMFLNLDHAKFTPSKIQVENMKKGLLDSFPYKEHLKKELFSS